MWMSHGDRVEALPRGLRDRRRERQLPGRGGRRRRRASSGACSSTPRWRTPRAGGEILANFLFRICGCEPSWTMAGFVERGGRGGPRRRSGRTGRAVCGLSGGVDSSVAAALVQRAIGDAADLHLRRQRPAARRTRRPRSSRCSATRSRPTCASSTPSERFLGDAGRGHRSRAEAQDHRARVHRRVRGGGASKVGRRASSWCRGRCTPT